jgi:hypothetical protein
MEFKNLEEKFRTFQNVLDHLCNVRQPANICDKDPSCYESILCLKSLIENDDMFNVDDDQKKNSLWTFLAKKNYELLFVDILLYLSRKCQKFKTNQNEKPILIFDFVLEIVYRLTEYQLKFEALLEFSVRLCNEANVCHALLSFFKRDKYLSKSWTNYDPHKRIINIMGILLNVSENPFVNWSDANKLDIEVILVGYASPHAKVYAEMTEKILKNVNRFTSLTQFLLYLTSSSLNGVPSRIVENEKVYNDLFFLRYKIKSKRAFENEENLLLTSSSTSFLLMLIDFLNHVNKKLMHEVNFDLFEIEIVKPRQTPSNLKQRIYSIFFNILVILNELMFRSEQARVYFTRTSLIKCLSQFLTENYVRKLRRSKHEKVILMLVQNLSLMSGWSSSSEQVNLLPFGLFQAFFRPLVSIFDTFYDPSGNFRPIFGL